MCVFVFRIQVMKGMCKQGYKDALHFLKKNGEKLWLSSVNAVRQRQDSSRVPRNFGLLIHFSNAYANEYNLQAFFFILETKLLLKDVQGKNPVWLFFSPLCSSGLLNLNGPYRGRQLMGIGEEGPAENDDEDGTKSAEEEAVKVHCSGCIEEHFIEHLSPTLRKGNEWDKDSFPFSPFATINRSFMVLFWQ